ncbi:MAG TPA: EFR1 family ferrodoxin [Spirochaetota bacterium]|nr:EFR1 family ferrodoxin [Spirochaetota bacterium]HPU86839.1 EFR1 family ferrodoxin [Spirochaetota bacterium]
MIDTRRSFLRKGALLTLSSLPLAAGCAHLEQRIERLKTSSPRTAAVLWYSQTGHTRVMGRLMAQVLRAEGLTVTDADYREFDASTLPSFDLVIMGSPVYYFRVPENLRAWIAKLPSLEGIPAAAFVTFGGVGHNQHNTSYELLEWLADRGAVPMRIAAFGHMSSYAPTWSSGRSARILTFRDLPNEQTFEAGRDFARKTVASVRARERASIGTEVSVFQPLRRLDMPWWTKLLASNHRIDPNTCIRCGKCERACPVGAVSVERNRVDSARCIFCVGCVNNCPTGAMKMTYFGSEVYGYREFLKRNGITLRLPRELADG